MIAIMHRSKRIILALKLTLVVEIQAILSSHPPPLLALSSTFIASIAPPAKILHDYTVVIAVIFTDAYVLKLTPLQMLSEL